MVGAIKTAGSNKLRWKEKLGRGPKISTAFFGSEIGAAPAPRECQWNIL
jgi:hypothetical protein